MAMIEKKLLVAVSAVVLMWASEAQASAILMVGNVPQAGDENVLLNTGAIGTQIFGLTNQTQLAVRFTGEELLTAPANGQARIDAVDDLFSYLLIDVPTGTFSSLILNPDATINGRVNFTAITTTGTTFFNFAVGESGSNFFTFTTSLPGERFQSIAVRTGGSLQFSDVAQIRIGGAQRNAVPDGGVTLGLLSCSLVGLGMLRRKFNVQLF